MCCVLLNEFADITDSVCLGFVYPFKRVTIYKCVMRENWIFALQWMSMHPVLFQQHVGPFKRPFYANTLVSWWLNEWSMVFHLLIANSSDREKNGVYSLTIIIIIIIGFAQMHSLVALLHSVSCSRNLNENAFFSRSHLKSLVCIYGMWSMWATKMVTSDVINCIN